MATVKTSINNVFRNTDETANNKKTNAVFTTAGFDGTEFVKLQTEPFEAIGKTMRINSADLATKISAYFKQFFHDLKGCNIIAMPNGFFVTEFFFEYNNEPVPEGKIKNLESVIKAASNSTNMLDKVQIINNRAAGKTFALNNETKQLLRQFMYGGVNKDNDPANKKFWSRNDIVNEQHIPVQTPMNMYDPFHRGVGAERVFVRVAGLDIRRIVQEIYGDKIITKTIVNETADVNHRSPAHYEVRFIKQVGANGTFIMHIEQFDVVAVEKSYVKENPTPQLLPGMIMY